MELAAQLFAVQDERQLPAAERLGGIAFHALVGPAVPEHDRARAVVALGDDPLELPVFDRVVLDEHRQTLVGGIQRWSLRDRPRAQDPFHLQAEVPVHLPGVMLLHDESRARPDNAGRALRLGGG